MIHLISDDFEVPKLPLRSLQVWMTQVAASYGKKLGDINYIFCSDRRILEINQTFLHHDYFTDIITFDYTQGDRISGDLYIGMETVASNADMLKTPFHEELCRVLAHGVLHLCGFGDKLPDDERNMRIQELKALGKRPQELI